MSNRLAFALVVPLVAVVLAALVIVNGVALGFAGEGCRFHDGKTFRWGAAIETGMVQLFFGLLFGIALALLSAVLRKQFVGQGLPRMVKWFETAAIVGLVLMMFGAVGEALVCRLTPYYTIASGMLRSGFLVLVAALGLLAVLYIKGLMTETK